MKGLSNLQFITMCIIVMVCGVAITGHESFKDGKDMAYDSIALAYRNAEIEEQKKQEEKNKDANQNSQERQEELQNIDVIYASNAVRTLQTAKYMMESQNLKVNMA